MAISSRVAAVISVFVLRKGAPIAVCLHVHSSLRERSRIDLEIDERRGVVTTLQSVQGLLAVRYPRHLGDLRA